MLLLDPVMLIEYKTVTQSGSKMNAELLFCHVTRDTESHMTKQISLEDTDSVRESKVCRLHSRLGPGSWTVYKQKPSCFSWISITFFIYCGLS